MFINSLFDRFDGLVFVDLQILPPAISIIL